MDSRTPREAGRSTRLPGTSACPSPPLSRVTGSSLVLSQASRLLGLLGAVTSSQTFRVRGARDSFERSNVAESPRVAVRLVFSSWLDGGGGSWEEDPRAQGLFHPVVPRVMCHRDLSLSMLTVAPGQVALVGLLCRHRAFEASFGRTHTRSLPRVPTQGHHVHPPPFSFEEVEAQRRPSAPGAWMSGLGPAGAGPPPFVLAWAPGARAHRRRRVRRPGFPGRHAAPGSFRVWAPLQMYGPAEQLGSSSGRRQSLWTAGRASSPGTCTSTARASLGSRTRLAHTPPSPSRPRPASRRHWALKMSGPALGRL